MKWVSLPVIYALGALLLASVLFGGWTYIRLQHARTALAEAKAEQAKVLQELAQKTAIAADKARRVYVEQTNLSAQLDAQHEAGAKHANETKTSVSTELESGYLQLRDQWKSCMSARATDRITTSATQVNAAPNVRTANPGDFVSIGANCDNDIRTLQGYLKIGRKTE